MDGFDDLLAPSRRALEDNPFADPFATRSGSPDPWATPYANTQSDDDYGRSATPTLDSYSTAKTYESSSSPAVDSTTLTPSDPLESAIHAEDHQRRSTSSSPGFRESVEPTVRATEPEEPSTLPVEPHHSPIPEEEILRPSSPSSPASSQGRHGKQPPSRSASRVLPPSPSTSKSSTEFISPLERRATPIGVTQSIAGLSLGGESLGGWQSERGAWGDQAEDDSDDDKPISQTVKLHDHGDNKIVSREVGIALVLEHKFTDIY
jgi:sorting nexin-1/2